MFKKYYIASKFRFIAFLTIMTLVITMSISATFNSSYADGKADKAYYAVTVESGDTLWTIATRYSDENTDIRKLVYDISSINGLKSADISVGQQLLIPA